MKVYHSIEEFVATSQPLSLTIGNFDGGHSAHQILFSKLKGHKVVLTFSNHPVEILENRPFYHLTTSLQKLNIFEQNGIDTTLLLPFTRELSQLSAKSFITYLHKHLAFSHLLLGKNAVIGHNREGDSSQLIPLSQELNFTLEYLPLISKEGITISSSEIRKHITSGNFSQASKLLGRPYSIMSCVEKGEQRGGGLLGFPTANFRLDQLCLPPFGVYSVYTFIDNKKKKGIANLGKAPTLHANRHPLLEVHLMDYEGSLYGKTVEIFFLNFLRKEKKFLSIDALKRQIQLDILSAF